MKYTTINPKIICLLCLIVLSFSLVSKNNFNKQEESYLEEMFCRASTGILKHRAIRDTSFNYLVNMGGTVVPYILRYVDTNDARELHTIWDITKKMGKEASPALIEALADTSEILVSQAAYMLGDIQDPEAFINLSELVDHESARVRINALRGLGKTGRFEALSLIDYAYSDTLISVRKQATAALKDLVKHDLDSLLVIAFHDTAYSVIQAGEIALKAYVKEDNSRVESLLRILPEQGKVALLKIIGELKRQENAKYVIDFIYHDSLRLRYHAWQALYKTDLAKAKIMLYNINDRSHLILRQLKGYIETL